MSAISQTPWNTAWGLLWSWHDVPVLFQNPGWQAQTVTAVSLWVSRAKYQFHLRCLSSPFCNDSPEWCSRHMVTWFGRHGDAFGTTENVFFHAFMTLRSVSPTSSFSVSFNGNRVKNHPEPWTCPLKTAWSLIPCTFMVHLLLCSCVQVRQAQGARVGWYCQAWPLQRAESLWWGLVLHTRWYALFLSLFQERFADVELGLQLLFFLLDQGSE